MKHCSIIPKDVNYRQDNTGRDTYVITSNGGTSKRPQSAFPLDGGIHMKFSTRTQIRPQSGAKVIHYHNIGDGRDNYISTNSGGVTSQTHKNTESRTQFTSQLRNYNSTQTDKFCFQVNLEELEKLKESQFRLTEKLSKPKKVSIPYQTQVQRLLGNDNNYSLPFLRRFNPGLPSRKMVNKYLSSKPLNFSYYNSANQSSLKR